jgi:hypothetical protein
MGKGFTEGRALPELAALVAENLSLSGVAHRLRVQST